MPLHGFTAVDPGYQQGNAVSNPFNKVVEPPFTATTLSLFDQIRNDPDKPENVTSQICKHIASVCQENSPESIYELGVELGTAFATESGQIIQLPLAGQLHPFAGRNLASDHLFRVLLGNLGGLCLDGHWSDFDLVCVDIRYNTSHSDLCIYRVFFGGKPCVTLPSTFGRCPNSGI
ncbi:MAG: hypothetical protein ACYDAM_08960 [Leptospirales bacterium]